MGLPSELIAPFSRPGVNAKSHSRGSGSGGLGVADCGQVRSALQDNPCCSAVAQVSSGRGRCLNTPSDKRVLAASELDLWFIFDRLHPAVR